MKTQIMKALTFKRYGKSPDIGFANIPRPTPKADELLVQVYAAGVNPVDNMIPTGMFKPVLHFQLPATLGSDLAGVVVEVGSRVTHFKPGDAIYANIFDLGIGAIAEFAVVPEHAAALKPANLDFVQAASIPMVGLTSWQALKERLDLRFGQKLFIPAGSGGIGSFAIQLAKHLGAKVGTTTSTGNVELVRNLGADDRLIARIFLFEGRLISVFGAIAGIVLGLLLCFLQQRFGLISLGGGNGSFVVDAYPVSVHATDVILILITVIAVGFLSVWYPVRYLSKRLLKK